MLDPNTGLQMDDKQSASYINEFFAGLTRDYPKVTEDWLELQCPENLPLFTVEEVKDVLNGTNINKAPCPHDPFLKIVKIFANCFDIPLADIFRESFQLKTFPMIWKKYKVSGIWKTIRHARFLKTYIRPTALTSVLARVQESFAVRWMYEDTDGNISDYGGLPKSSGILALVNLLHKCIQSNG